MKKLSFPGAKLFSSVRSLLTPNLKRSPFDDQTFFGFSGQAKKFNSKNEQMHAYEQIAWVSIAVDCLIRDGGSQEYFFIDEKTSAVIDKEKLPTDLSIPFDSGFAGLPFSGGLIGIAIAHRAITGNAFYLMTNSSAYGQARGVVEQFIPLNPATVKTIINDDATAIDHYEITMGHKTLTIPPEYILHFKQSCIMTPFSGTGNITKMRLTAEGELASDEFNNEFMKRRATPSLFVKDEEPRNAEEFKRTLSLLRNSYEGIENSGRLLFLSGKGVDAKTLQLSQKDIQFLETKQFNRQTILSMFGVPPSVAGVPDNVNYATANAFRLGYLSSTINPLLRELESAINLGFMKQRFPGILFQFKKHATGDLLAIKQQVEAGIITPNRAAELMGETTNPEDSARESYYLPSNLMPISDGKTATPKTPSDPNVTDPNNPNNPADPNAPVKKNCSCGLDHKTAAEVKDLISDPDNVEMICDYYEKKLPTNRKSQVRFLRVSLLRRKLLTKKYEEKFGKYFKDQGERVIEKAKEFAAHHQKSIKMDPFKMVSFIFNTHDENQKLSEVAQPLHTAGVTGAVSDINGLTSGVVASSMANPFIKRAVLRCGELLIKNHDLNGVTVDKLQDIVGEWLAGDQNIQSLTDTFGQLFDGYEGWRARRIARTESRIAWDQGAQVSYKDQGVQYCDVVGCESFEPDSDCGRTGIPVDQCASLSFHPNHIGAVVPGEKPDNADAVSNQIQGQENVTDTGDVE